MAISGTELGRLADVSAPELRAKFPAYVRQVAAQIRALSTRLPDHTREPEFNPTFPELDRIRALDEARLAEAAFSIILDDSQQIDHADDIAQALADYIAQDLGIWLDQSRAPYSGDTSEQYLIDDLVTARSLVTEMTGINRDHLVGPLTAALERAQAYYRGIYSEESIRTKWVGVWADLAWIIYVLLDVPYDFGQETSMERPVQLKQSDIVTYVGAFEEPFSAIVNAGQDGLIDPDHFESIQNLLEQIQLVRQRPSAKTQQLELLIVELLEILNGSIQDEPRFRDEFLVLGVEHDTAVVAAHELVRAIAQAEQHLGTDDPVESALQMRHMVIVNSHLEMIEEPLRRKARDALVTSATGALSASAGTSLWKLYGNDFMRIARGVIRAFSDIFEHLF